MKIIICATTALIMALLLMGCSVSPPIEPLSNTNDWPYQDWRIEDEIH